MDGVLGAAGVNAVPRVAVDNNSAHVAVTLATAKDHPRVRGLVTRNPVKGSGDAGRIGARVQCHAVSAERHELETAYRRTSARESLSKTKSANFPAVTVSTFDYPSWISQNIS